MIRKSSATCQGPSRRKHIKFMMTLTEAPFQVYFATVEQNAVYLKLFILYGQYNDFLFALVSIFYLHGNFEDSPLSRGSLQFLLLIDASWFGALSLRNWVVLQSFLRVWLMLHIFNY